MFRLKPDQLARMFCLLDAGGMLNRILAATLQTATVEFLVLVLQYTDAFNTDIVTRIRQLPSSTRIDEWTLVRLYDSQPILAELWPDRPAPDLRATTDEFGYVYKVRLIDR